MYPIERYTLEYLDDDGGESWIPITGVRYNSLDDAEQEMFKFYPHNQKRVIRHRMEVVA